MVLGLVGCVFDRNKIGRYIACGGEFEYILKNDGSIWSCGDNINGQLGIGSVGGDFGRSQVTTNINNDVKQVACGGNHAFIIKNDGSVWCCGKNYNGQLGLGDTATRDIFTQVINNVRQIDCGAYHTFILKNDGSVWCCGRNQCGQLGVGDSNIRNTFTQITNDVRQIACGNQDTFIIKNDGSVWACGYNGNGELGLGDGTNRYAFTQVTTNINNDVKQIACGGLFTFILKNDGSVLGAGYSYGGFPQIGNSTSSYTFSYITSL